MWSCLVVHKVPVTLALCLSFLLCLCGCLNQEGESNGIVTMTMKEFVNDYAEDNDNENKTFTGWFKSVDEGDTVLINDTIEIMFYEDASDTTYVEFSSLEENPVQFPVQGYLDAKFQVGDTIEMTLHIIKVNFVQQVTPIDSITVEIETYREGWDSEENAPVPLPQEYIRLA